MYAPTIAYKDILVKALETAEEIMLAADVLLKDVGVSNENLDSVATLQVKLTVIIIDARKLFP